MRVTTQPWEHSLIALAQDAWQNVGNHPLPDIHDQDLVAQAYATCADITKKHSRSFYLASSLLPAEKQRAARALYAFCRITDDIVDRPEIADAGSIETALDHWRWRALTPTPPSDDLVALAWADTRQRFHIPTRYAEQLIEGVGRDLNQSHYQTFSELTTYCYGVASTVGLMSMYIIGFSGPEAVPYAIKLGVALQLTNILRDLAEDLRHDRIYLPLDELESFGITRDDLENKNLSSNWRQFMRFQIERTHQLYEEAWPGIALLNEDGRFAIAAAAELYRGILDDIVRHDYDVFHRRAFVSTSRKLRRLPAIWYRARTVRPPSHVFA